MLKGDKLTFNRQIANNAAGIDRYSMAD